MQNSGEQKVSRGENARRKLTHVNIVRQLETIADPSANEGKLELTLPPGLTADKCHVIAFVQSSDAVTAVAKSEIVASSATKKRRPMKKGQKDMSSDSTSEKAASAMYVTAHKPPMVEPKMEDRQLINERHFLGMLTGDRNLLKTGLQSAKENWDQSYVSMLLEVARFLPGWERSQVMALIESKTGQRFGNDFDKWLQWNWKQDFEAHPGYGNFKSALYSQLDPRFAEYFVDTKDPLIRLDEIRWGGVVRDGIPPLKNPKMLAARDASYLADSDVVFGIELNGDARAYPNRILAWHEMFKDTIGGESVCGVY